MTTMPQIDQTPARAFGYMLTLTSSDDFTDAQEDTVVQWHKRKCENCLLVMERHKDGRKHYHSTILVKAPKTAGGLTRQVKNLYKEMAIECNSKTFKVVSTTDQIGAFIYLFKAQDKDDPVPLLIMGWSLSWIKQQTIGNVKKIPRKMLMANRVVLNPANAIPYCLKFAEASGIPITGKMAFKTLVKLMVKDGYSFDNTKFPWLYSQLMCICGDDRALDQQIDNQLSFLD